jgi:hypothetical protein
MHSINVRDLLDESYTAIDLLDERTVPAARFMLRTTSTVQ